MTVAILYGGRSSEHEVSLVSAAGVLKELSTMEEYDLLPIGITRTGRWFAQDPTHQIGLARQGAALTVEHTDRAVLVVPGAGITVATAPERVLSIDCVFPVLHGSFGEDGTLQGLLEMADLAYVGSGVVGSAVGMDKIRSKQLWNQWGLPIVPYLEVRRNSAGVSTQAAEVTGRIEDAFGFPVFVKPNAAGSSVGVTKVTRPVDLAAALSRAFAVDPVVLIEQAMTVREIETSVMGNEEIRSFPPGEVVPTHEFYDYEAKYEDPQGARLSVPADITPDQASRIEQLSRDAFRAVDGAGFARVDCFIDSRDGSVYVNEINTIPGFTPISMFPKMVEGGGMSYGELLKELIRLALERSGSTKVRDFTAR